MFNVRHDTSPDAVEAKGQSGGSVIRQGVAQYHPMSTFAMLE